MGIESSKSPLERRNTVARRSQRRIIHNNKAKVDKIFQEIKKFKGLEEDDTFNSILSELDHIRNDMKRKARELQPQVRAVHETTLKRLDEAVQALSDKLNDNLDKARKKQDEQEEKARLKEEKEAKKKKKKKGESDDEDEVKSIENHEDEDENALTEEANDLPESKDKRQTVELKFVQILTPEEDNIPKKMVSPEEKRKSILKVGGVAVMPGAIMNEISTKSKHLSVRYHQSKENLNDDPGARLNEIVENLQAIECQIAEFVGRKHGTQYNRIRDKLNGYLAEVSIFNTNDDFFLEQIKLCRNYVASCMTFLDEKAIDDRKYDSRDDVFLPDVKETNSFINPVEVEEKLNRLTKTTAI